MKRFSAPPAVLSDSPQQPDDDDSDASSSLSDGSKKVKTAQSFESLFNSESLSDVILDINQGEYVFHAHKMIIGLKSERLAALITSMASVHPDTSGKPVLYLQENCDCSAVFSRFLYFIYSGAVWLHRDYVVPLFKLSAKYGVGALAAHCENYIVQILNKMLIQDPASPLIQSLLLSSVCDLYEEPDYRDDTKKIAFQILCKRFTEFVRSERWITSNWLTVYELLRSDDCTCEENLILVSATDWMKRNKLQDKARIQEILSSIRYPRLPRRVLYHLHATSSFRKFPPVQDLIDAAIRYHCFKDVSEAQAEFTGLQYRARGCNRNSGLGLFGSESSDAFNIRSEPNNNTNDLESSVQENEANASTSNQTNISCESRNELGLSSNRQENATKVSVSVLPFRHRSRSEDRNRSLDRDYHLAGSQSQSESRGHAIFDSSLPSFYSPSSPVAAASGPRLRGQRNSFLDRDNEEDNLSLLSDYNGNNHHSQVLDDQSKI